MPTTLPTASSSSSSSSTPQPSSARRMSLLLLPLLLATAALAWWTFSSSFPASTVRISDLHLDSAPPPAFLVSPLATLLLPQQPAASAAPPWVGHHALTPPATAMPGSPHVRVVIRVHHEHDQLVRGLVHSLRHQAAPGAGVSVDFALVPTDPRGVPVAQAIAQDLWLDPLDPFPHVYAVAFDDAFFAHARNRSQPFDCTPEERRQATRDYGQGGAHRICTYDNHLYYQCTDVGVVDVLAACPWCTHVLVTNGDNAYHPAFLQRTLLARVAPRFGAGGGGWDLVATDFTTNGYTVKATFARGGIDLGSVLLSKAIVAKVGGFVPALPPGARGLEAHDADWWFVKKALEVGGKGRVVHELLFFHN